MPTTTSRRSLPFQTACAWRSPTIARSVANGTIGGTRFDVVSNIFLSVRPELVEGIRAGTQNASTGSARTESFIIFSGHVAMAKVAFGMKFGVAILGLFIAMTARAYSIEGKSLAELRDDLAAGRVTSVQLVRLYTERIKSIDQRGPTLQSVLALNADAMTDARDLDRERRERGA